jgi:hypothetical protein
MALPVFLQAVANNQLNWDEIEQRCQTEVIQPQNNCVVEIWWDNSTSCPLIHNNAPAHGMRYHVRSIQEDLDALITIRDCFRAIGIIDAEFVLTWPWNANLHIENVLDTPVIHAPVCQMNVYPEGIPIQNPAAALVPVPV